MKSLSAIVKILAFPAVLLVGLVACEDDDKRPTPPADYPRNLGDIISSSAQRAKLNGMVFYLGNSSSLPTLDSITVDHECSYDNTIASNIGRIYANYVYNYSRTTGDSVPVALSLSYRSLNSNDRSTFVDPDSILIRRDTLTQNYTILFRADGVVDGVSYKSLRMFSGTLDLQLESFTITHDCFVMLETGPDPDDKVADVGTIRVFKGPG